LNCKIIIAKTPDIRVIKGYIQVAGNVLGQERMGASGKKSYIGWIDLIHFVIPTKRFLPTCWSFETRFDKKS
jgi:hypothetical protein